MKRFSTVLRYLRDKRGNILLYFLCNLFSIVFSLVSLTMLGPFMELLFYESDRYAKKPEFVLSANGLLEQLKYQLNQIIVEHDKVYALGVICISIIIAILLKNFFLYLSFRVLIPVRNHVMTRLRADLYSKILFLPISYFTEQRKGDIMSRMSNDSNEVEWSIISTMETLIKEPLTILIYLGSLVLISPTLSLFLLVLLPLAGFIIGRVSRSLRKQSLDSQSKLGSLMTLVEETLGGLRVIKAFSAERILNTKFGGINNYLNHVRNKMLFRRDLASPLSEVLGVVVLCVVLWFGGQMALKGVGGLQPSSFIIYIALFSMIINPAKSLSTAFYNIQRGSAAIERIEEILKAPIVIEEPKNPKPITSFEKEIEFRNVSFRYNDKVVLENINLKIPKGKTVALVGSSGAGKSTLVDLVPRFHDASGGSLLIDGNDIKDYSLSELRQLMGIVTQEPILFNDSIAANISLGYPSANIAEIEDAAKIANAHNFIMHKEDGYQSGIGDRGNKLSGGEKQRLTIARAVLKNPPILILDEATSSLDTESERLVQDAIQQMMKNRTSIVIAHRLSTIRHADEIIVLQKGRIVERGTHDQLIGLNGFYKKLVDLQEVK